MKFCTNLSHRSRNLEDCSVGGSVKIYRRHIFKNFEVFKKKTVWHKWNKSSMAKRDTRPTFDDEGMKLLRTAAWSTIRPILELFCYILQNIWKSISYGKLEVISCLETHMLPNNKPSPRFNFTPAPSRNGGYGYVAFFWLFLHILDVNHVMCIHCCQFQYKLQLCNPVTPRPFTWYSRGAIKSWSRWGSQIISPPHFQEKFDWKTKLGTQRTRRYDSVFIIIPRIWIPQASAGDRRGNKSATSVHSTSAGIANV